MPVNRFAASVRMLISVQWEERPTLQHPSQIVISAETGSFQQSEPESFSPQVTTLFLNHPQMHYYPHLLRE